MNLIVKCSHFIIYINVGENIKIQFSLLSVLSVLQQWEALDIMEEGWGSSWAFKILNLESLKCQ